MKSDEFCAGLCMAINLMAAVFCTITAFRCEALSSQIAFAVVANLNSVILGINIARLLMDRLMARLSE